MININDYSRFVETVTSQQSNEVSLFIDNINKIVDFNPSLAITGVIGIQSESGELAEIVKKVLFQGKPFTEDTRFHIKRELGDIIWYWVNTCRAFGLNPQEVIQENITKLEQRYPGGFTAFLSENRRENDI